MVKKQFRSDNVLCFIDSTHEELLCRVLKVIENGAADIPVDSKEDLTGKDLPLNRA